jgi:hypothetical protein
MAILFVESCGQSAKLAGMHIRMITYGRCFAQRVDGTVIDRDFESPIAPHSIDHCIANETATLAGSAAVSFDRAANGCQRLIERKLTQLATLDAQK